MRAIWVTLKYDDEGGGGDFYGSKNVWGHTYMATLLATVKVPAIANMSKCIVEC